MAVLLLGAAACAADKAIPKTDDEIAARVTHGVAMYPWYTMFDIVSLKVTAGRATLTGTVTVPSKKDDIDHLVKNLPGVSALDDEIRVLPPSSKDDQLRRELARVIYGDPAMAELAHLTPPPIHIIVENGRVTLAGVVDTEQQKAVAGIRASNVGMTFGPVVNNLVVAVPPAKKKA